MTRRTGQHNPWSKGNKGQTNSTNTEGMSNLLGARTGYAALPWIAGPPAPTFASAASPPLKTPPNCNQKRHGCNEGCRLQLSKMWINVGPKWRRRRSGSVQGAPRARPRVWKGANGVRRGCTVAQFIRSMRSWRKGSKSWAFYCTHRSLFVVPHVVGCKAQGHGSMVLSVNDRWKLGKRTERGSQGNSTCIGSHSWERQSSCILPSPVHLHPLFIPARAPKLSPTSSIWAGVSALNTTP